MGLKRTLTVFAGVTLAFGLSAVMSPSEAAHSSCAPGNPELLPVTLDDVEPGDGDWYDASSSTAQQLRGGPLDPGLTFLDIEVYAWDGGTQCTKIDSARFWGAFGLIGNPFNDLPTVPAGDHLVRVTALDSTAYALVTAPPTQ